MEESMQQLSKYSALLPLLVYLFYKSRFEFSKWLLFYFIMSFSVDCLLSMMQSGLILKQYLELYIYHAFFILEFLMLSFYFYKCTIFKDKRTIWFISLLGVAVYYCVFANAGFPAFNAKGCAVFSFILISYCIFGFKQLLENEVPVYLEKIRFFWVLCGLLLYFSGNFFLYTFYEQIKGLSVGFATSLWSFVHNSLNILKCCLIAFSFTKKQDE